MSDSMSGDDKRAITELIDSSRDELLELVRELISTPSMNPPGDERAVVEVIGTRLKQLGLTGLETRSGDRRRPNLICRVEGRREGRVLMLNGHTDTVGPGDEQSWHGNPFKPEVRDGRLYGLGAADMKAGLGAMIFAAYALSHLRDRWSGALLLVLAADEEWGSHYGTSHLVAEGGLGADAAVVCEPCGLSRDFDSLHIAGRGISRFKFRVHGTRRHSGLSYLPGTVNAGVGMAGLLQMAGEHLHFDHSDHDLYPEGPLLNLGLRILAGEGYGIIPERAEAWNEVRTLPGMARWQVEEGLRNFASLCQAERPDLGLEIEFEDPPHDWTPAVEIDRNEPIVASALRGAETVLGEKPRVAGYPASTDSRFLIPDGGIPSITAFGPGLIMVAHAPDEYVSVESIVQAAKIYALAALDYLGRGSSQA